MLVLAERISRLIDLNLFFKSTFEHHSRKPTYTLKRSDKFQDNKARQVSEIKYFSLPLTQFLQQLLNVIPNIMNEKLPYTVCLINKAIFLFKSWNMLSLLLSILYYILSIDNIRRGHVSPFKRTQLHVNVLKD